MATPIKGIVSVISKQDKDKGSWSYYDVQLEDGTDYVVSVNTDKYEAPSKGDNVILWPAKFGQHNFGGLVDPVQEAKYASKSGASKVGSTSNTSSSDYWEKKFRYEVKSKDASLRFQGIFGKISDIYCAAIASGMTPTKANSWIDKAIEKTNEVCDTFDVSNGTFRNGQDTPESAIEDIKQESQTETKATQEVDDELPF